MEKIKEYPEMLKYRQVRKVLEAEIAAGRFGGDEPLPREDVLAKKLGVGRVTLRRAMGGLVEAGLIQRIKGKGTFVIPAAELCKTNLIGVTCGGSDSIICGAAEVLAKRGYVPAAMSYLHDGVKPEAERINVMAELGASGFLVRPACELRGEHRDNSELFEKISKSGRAVVTVDKILPEHKVSAVVCDHEAIDRQMVEYLCQQNVQRVVYIGSGDGYIAGVRYEAMMAAGRGAGLKFTVKPEEICFSASQGYYPAAYVGAARLGKICKSGAEAVACYSPQLAAGILDGLKRSSWAAGNCVKHVLTFGGPADAAMLKNFAVDGVETVMIQSEPAELASEAATMLLAHIDNGVPAEPMVKKVQPSVVMVETKPSDVPRDWHEY